MKTKILLQIASTIIGSLSASSCSPKGESDLSQLPMVNSVSAMKERSATPIPLTDDKLFVVTGRVSHSLYIMGEGVISLEDINNPDVKLYLIAKNKHKKGEIITAQIKKKEMLSFDDDSYAIYVEK